MKRHLDVKTAGFNAKKRRPAEARLRVCKKKWGGRRDSNPSSCCALRRGKPATSPPSPRLRRTSWATRRSEATASRKCKALSATMPQARGGARVPACPAHEREREAGRRSGAEKNRQYLIRWATRRSEAEASRNDAARRSVGNHTPSAGGARAAATPHEREREAGPIF